MTTTIHLIIVYICSSKWLQTRFDTPVLCSSRAQKRDVMIRILHEITSESEGNYQHYVAKQS